MMRAAMIGLGNLGGRMAVRLRDSGVEMVGFDVRPERAEELSIAPAKSIAEACEAGLVLLSLPSDKAIATVIRDDGGIGATAADGTTVVDLSTASPSASREHHAYLAERGIRFLDAGVSGGPARAEDGTLALMVGGDAAVLEEVRPILERIGSSIHHLGEAGNGHATKAINNYLNGVSLAATAEAMVVGVKAGLDPEQLLDVINESTGQNWATHNRFPRIIAGDYIEGGLSNRLMAKDLDLYLALADGSGAPAILGSSCRSVFGLAIASGYEHQVSNTVVDAIGDVAGGARIQKSRGGE